MPRGRKKQPKTVEEQIKKVEEEIDALQEELARKKARRKELLAAKEQEDIHTIYSAIKASGRSINDVLNVLDDGGRQTDDTLREENETL